MNKMLSSIALLAITGNVLMAGGDIVPVEPVVLEEPVSDEWKFHASINAWLPGMRIATPQGPIIKITLHDILQNLNLTAMSTLGAQKGKWGFLADIIYMNMSKSTLLPLDPPSVLTNIKMKSWIVTPMVTYRVVEADNLSLDLMAGARYLYIDLPMEFDYIQTVDTSVNLWDGVVGLRGNYELNEKWFIPFHFDVGTGDVDLTWQAFAGVGYKYENWDVIAGYRYLEWQFDESDTGGEAIKTLTVNGPMFGFKYHF